MNIVAIQTALEAVKIPGTERTLGSEKAVQLLEERSDGLHIGLKFGFPVGHIAADIANSLQEALSPLHPAKAVSANPPPPPILPPPWHAWAREWAYWMPTSTVRASRPCWACKTANLTNKTKN